MTLREKNGKFRSLLDFINRVDAKDVNKLQLEGLTKAGVFDEFDKSTLQENSEWQMESRDLAQLLTGGNNLQESALKIYPEIGLLLNTMRTLYPRDRKIGLFAPQMSGSGASCFALFEDKKAADMLCRKIQQAGYWSVSTKFMSNF